MVLLLVSVISCLWAYQPSEESGVLGTAAYLQKWSDMKRAQEEQKSVLTIHGKQDFDQLIAIVSRCKPVVVMIYEAGNPQEKKQTAIFDEVATTFKGIGAQAPKAVVCAVMECTKNQENRDILSFIKDHERIKDLALPSYLFFMDAGLYATDGSPAILQGFHSKENLVNVIRSKFFSPLLLESKQPGTCDLSMTPRQAR
jgi:hypothetical protein